MPDLIARSPHRISLLLPLIFLIVASTAHAQADSILPRVAPCMTCHGKQGRAAKPGIGGEPATAQ